MHHRYVVDGMPVLWNSQPGLLRATLRFSVGLRDEEYATFGISRRIAELTAHTVRRQRPELPAPVVTSGFEETQFTVSGRPDHVTEALEVLCQVLSDLPAGQGDDVAIGNGDGPGRWFDVRTAAALNARYGSQGAGLAGHEEIQDCAPGNDALLAHAEAWFNRSNTVLTLTGPEPEVLRLPLPPGERPSRHAPSASHSDASWAFRDTDSVTLSVETPLVSAAATVACRILAERVTAALADRAGSAPGAEVTTVLHDATTAIRILVVTPPAGEVETVATMLWAQARGLALAEPTRDEVIRNTSSHNGAPAGQSALDAAARSELFGTPFLSEGSNAAAFAAVTERDVRAAWHRAMERAQLVVPTGPILRLAGPGGRRLWCSTCWTWDEKAPWGQVFRPSLVKHLRTRTKQRHWAVLTPTSVVACTPQAYHELRFDDVLALERWGAERRLIGRCGCTIGINPAWFRNGQRLIQAVDKAVPADLTFDGVDGLQRGDGRSAEGVQAPQK